MKTVLNVKVDMDIKKKAQKTAKDLGIPLSLVVNANLRDFVMKKQFHVEFPPEKMTKALEDKLAIIEKDIKKNRNWSGPFTTPKEAADYLRSL